MAFEQAADPVGFATPFRIARRQDAVIDGQTDALVAEVGEEREGVVEAVMRRSRWCCNRGTCPSARLDVLDLGNMLAEQVLDPHDGRQDRARTVAADAAEPDASAAVLDVEDLELGAIHLESRSGFADQRLLDLRFEIGRHSMSPRVILRPHAR